MRFLDGSDLFCHSLTVSEQLLNISNLSLTWYETLGQHFDTKDRADYYYVVYYYGQAELQWSQIVSASFTSC